MVDFSLPDEQMHELNIRTVFHWVDHHYEKTAKLIESGFTPNGGCLLASGESPAACQLTWEYLMGDTPIPPAVRLLAAYDCWDQSDEDLWEERILPFQFGVKSYRTDPWCSIWGQLLYADEKSAIEPFIAAGRHILRSMRMADARDMSTLVYPVRWEGLKTLAVNKRTGSPAFAHHPEHDRAQLLLAYRYDPSVPGWRVQLWPGPANPDLDVAHLAAKHHGGGHKGAAGFMTTDLPQLIDGWR